MIDQTDSRNILEMRGIVKRFPGVVANDRIDFRLRGGEIHVLLGENGAGKSTLMKVLFGIYSPDAGEIEWKGRPLRGYGPSAAIELGIGMVHQHFTLIPTLSVAENVMLGRRSPRGLLFDKDLAVQTVEEASQRLGIKIDPREKVSRLDAGAQQWVEIIRAVSREPRLLILDEPTSVLTPQETGRLLGIVEAMANAGVTVCLVTHKLKAALSVADRVTVLRSGQVVDTVKARETSEVELARMMVGQMNVADPQRSPTRLGPVVLRVEQVRAAGDQGHLALRGVSLELRSGEILGIAGVAGNGQQELAEVIAGLRPAREGRVLVAGEDATHWSPRRLIQAGVAYIPDKPWERAVLGQFTLGNNLALRTDWSGGLARYGLLNRGALRDRTKSLIEEYDVRPSRIGTPAGKLSGGNLQKFVLARELSRKPKLILAVNPTAGLDVRARAFIHDRIAAARSAARGVLLISADLDEVLELSDRVVVICSGKVVGTFAAGGATVEQIGLLMGGTECLLSSAVALND
jgi:simple sugar transport system ATP-binding protein